MSPLNNWSAEHLKALSPAFYYVLLWPKLRNPVSNIDNSEYYLHPGYSSF